MKGWSAKMQQKNEHISGTRDKIIEDHQEIHENHQEVVGSHGKMGRNPNVANAVQICVFSSPNLQL